MPLNPFDLPDPMLRQMIRTMSPAALRRQLIQMADTLGDEAFGARMAREIVARTRPDQAIPDTYARYRSLVRDGIEFFLSQISRRRMLDLVISQLAMDADTCCQERLLALAQRFPTLHKLGQLIARHPDIDPAVRGWLINLENGLYGTNPDKLEVRIHAELGSTGKAANVHVTPTILAEASVGAVIPFHWQPSPDGSLQHGVFKVLRPGIRRHLNEELGILGKTAVFFHDHRTRYPLKDFRFLEIFEDVREMMIHEIDLAAEQRLLGEASHFYADMPDIRIPRRLPLSTSAMTAMDHLDGPKLLDADLNGPQRKRMADLLFTAVVLNPLFSKYNSSLFHGDPHAGNILAVFTDESTDPAIGLVDWSLAGHLARSDRVETVHLIQALLKNDLTGMCDAIRSLAMGGSQSTPKPRKYLRDLISGWMHEPANKRLPLVKQTFRLLESLSMEGLVFPADLMLFRKAIFTLEGVLHDLWPAFDMDAAIACHLMALVQQEFPLRLVNLLFPLADRPEKYTSLISNQDLQFLIAHQSINALFASSHRLMGPLMGWNRAIGVAWCPG
ncbi:AarF/UbiB family protein [Desulfosarcina ovata]|uniref:2-octaprenylphenol hydroxylase n=1 Tax=Desulfosarcina ovata subsp. ovata TaxID=2752305 RepID=A0A5K8AFF1_9BACT|nr:AarF/UbiB family protein [Desulfosarcina ovata]BBO91327.1 2-octaprenylphenol hydroxylase [Desulfosarcina ovata subsp. ovata]